MEDQINRVEERLSQLETKMAEESNSMAEIKNDVEQLEVADRLRKRLETNVDKILNLITALSEHIFDQNEEDVKSKQSTQSTASQQEHNFQKQLESVTNVIVNKMDEILYMKNDLTLVKEQYQELKDKQNYIISQIEKLGVDIDDHLKAPLLEDYVWTIKDINAKLSLPEFRDSSPVIKLHGCLFGAQATIHSVNENLYLFLALIETRHFRALTKIKFLPTLTVAICDVDTNNHEKDLVRVCDPQFGYGTYQYNTTYYRILLCKKGDISSAKYICNDALHVKMALFPQQNIEKPFSTNGTLLWTVHDYQKCRAMEEEGLVTCQQSPHFYTSDKGYRVKLELELRNGVAKVRVYFINGEFDRLLNSAFAHATTLCLVDQSTNWLSNNDKVVTVRKSNIQDRYYEINLSPNTDLRNLKDSYVKNDTIIIKADVKPSTPA